MRPQRRVRGPSAARNRTDRTDPTDPTDRSDSVRRPAWGFGLETPQGLPNDRCGPAQVVTLTPFDRDEPGAPTATTEKS